MLLEGLRQDLRYGARTLGRHPGFTSVSILTLALGIAVNTVVFTAYKAVVARPVDAREPDTLVNIAVRLQSGGTTALLSYPDFEAFRDGLRSFSGVIAATIEELTLSGTNGVMLSRPDGASLLSSLGSRFHLRRTRRSRALSSCQRTTSPCWVLRPSVGGRSTA